MKHRRLTIALGVAAVCLAAGFGYLKLSASGVEMTLAAEKFVKSLSAEQRAKAILAYDTPQRTDWHYIPKPTRKGLQVKEMNDEQRTAALDLLHSTLSALGYGKATKIMRLETILHELEKQRTGGPLRDPQRYFFTVFGQPDVNGRWGLSIEGHHLSLNFVVDHDKVISSTPTFFGANPGVLLADYGPEFKKGLRVLAKEEELAFQLLQSLTPEQRKTAVIAQKAPSDVRGAGSARPPLSPAVGLAAGEMSKDQVTILRTLIEEYAHNLPDDVAADRLAAIEKEGYSGIKFAWAGAEKPGIGHDYRVQGATFLIEFNNTQPDSAGNLANHIHSVWYNLAGSFAIGIEK
ncbi:MAG: DUF3500 domain-containing protein [Planctomycetia bacterium]|nr:DUF3500 domain-containing protein [Planctomycetia bacterium]